MANETSRYDRNSLEQVQKKLKTKRKLIKDPSRTQSPWWTCAGLKQVIRPLFVEEKRHKNFSKAKK